MSRQNIPYRTSSVVELIAPTNVLTDSTLDYSNDGAICSFKVYDPAKDEQLSASEIAGQSVFAVTNPGAFLVGDQIEVSQDDGTLLTTSVDSVQAQSGTITGVDPLTDSAALGSRVRVKLGDTIAMTEYGTAELETRDWGFRGTLSSTHAGLDLDLEVDIEISFSGDPGNPGTLDLLDVINGVIKPNHECES